MLRKINSYAQQSGLQAGYKLAKYTGAELIAEDEIKEDHPDSFTFYQIESNDGTTICLMPATEKNTETGDKVMAEKHEIPFKEMVDSGKWWRVA